MWCAWVHAVQLTGCDLACAPQLEALPENLGRLWHLRVLRVNGTCALPCHTAPTHALTTACVPAASSGTANRLKEVQRCLVPLSLEELLLANNKYGDSAGCMASPPTPSHLCLPVQDQAGAKVPLHLQHAHNAEALVAAAERHRGCTWQWSLQARWLPDGVGVCGLRRCGRR